MAKRIRDDTHHTDEVIELQLKISELQQILETLRIKTLEQDKEIVTLIEALKNMPPDPNATEAVAAAGEVIEEEG